MGVHGQSWQESDVEENKNNLREIVWLWLEVVDEVARRACSRPGGWMQPFASLYRARRWGGCRGLRGLSGGGPGCRGLSGGGRGCRGLSGGDPQANAGGAVQPGGGGHPRRPSLPRRRGHDLRLGGERRARRIRTEDRHVSLAGRGTGSV